jgi:hypothetical protein
MCCEAHGPYGLVEMCSSKVTSTEAMAHAAVCSSKVTSTEAMAHAAVRRCCRTSCNGDICAAKPMGLMGWFSVLLYRNQRHLGSAITHFPGAENPGAEPHVMDAIICCTYIHSTGCVATSLSGVETSGTSRNGDICALKPMGLMAKRTADVILTLDSRVPSAKQWQYTGNNHAASGLPVSC